MGETNQYSFDRKVKIRTRQEKNKKQKLVRNREINGESNTFRLDSRDIFQI
jgi:hypothetical protein